MEEAYQHWSGKNRAANAAQGVGPEANFFILYMYLTFELCHYCKYVYNPVHKITQQSQYKTIQNITLRTLINRKFQTPEVDVHSLMHR